MLVVADASPLNYLVLIGQAGLLESLFQNVVIPPAVFREPIDGRAPTAVRDWVRSPPSWLQVVPLTTGPDAGLAHLDEGERQAIALAQEMGAGLLLDEVDARREAGKRGLKFIGTLGVLREGAARDLVNLETAIEKLLTTSFYVDPKLIEALLRDASRRSK
jgi:predicted nucleic acid-binding protein